MHIIQLSYKRTFNIGNYENEVIEVTVGIGTDDNPEVVLSRMRAWTLERFFEGHPGVKVIA